MHGVCWDAGWLVRGREEEEEKEEEKKGDRLEKKISVVLPRRSDPGMLRWI